MITDSIFTYTDGVPEAANASLELFGEGRLLKTLNQSSDTVSEETVHRMYEAVDLFAEGAPQSDDITMLSLKYYGTRTDQSSCT